MIPSLLLLVFLVVLFIKRDRTEEKRPESLTKKRRLPPSLRATGLTLERLIRKLKEKVNGRPEGAPGPSLKSPEERREETAALFAGIYLILLAGAVLGLVFSVLQWKNAEVTELARPEFGEAREVALVAKVGGKTEEVRVTVSGKLPSDADWDAVFDEAFAREKPNWLGENESFDSVTKDLRFSREDDLGIRYRFETGDPELLSEGGYLLGEEIPEEGVRVSVKTTLSYEDRSKTYEWAVTLFPEPGKEKSPLTEALLEADENGRTDDRMILPDSVSGSTVRFSEKVLSPYAVLAVTLLFAVLLFFLPASRAKEERKKRETALAYTYAEAVSGLTAYISAGMNIRSAWQRVAENYRADVRAGRREKEYVFEEMLVSGNELNGGVPEEEVYVNFGRRIGQHRYVRFANLLAQNMKQGISGLSGTLEGEMREALEERKRIALKKGEEAGTKLLAPMMMLLGIVILVLIVPVFMML